MRKYAPGEAWNDELIVTVPIKRWQLVYSDIHDHIWGPSDEPRKIIGLNDGSSNSYHDGIEVQEASE